MLRAPTIGLAILALATASSAARAQSSGNFSATGTDATCAIGAGGTFSGGTGGIGISSFTANLSTGSGNGTTLDIRPALVTGLFTQTKIDTSVPSASADIGIEVCVTVDGSGAGVLPKSCVVYDQRFQQISSQLFSQISTCFSTVTTTACTVDNDCSFLGAGFICNNPTGAAGAGKCVSGPNPLCNFDLILSTLSAHSFDFVIPVDNKKPHVITANWKVIGAGPSGGNASVLSCVGPGILTVTQGKVFNNSGSLSFP
jgi:hypothetical protein